uniref:Uncharacterized protein n=1 Tax=Eptatretus burgeri TaxID=7764 RepID=A0A8C4QIS0_EPTBU
MSCSRRLPLWAIVYGSISIPFLLEPVAVQSLSPAGTGYPPCSVSTDDTLMYGSLFSHNMLPGNASHCQWNIKNPDSDSLSMFIVLSVDLADSCQHYKLLLLEDLNGHSLSSNGSGFGNSPLCIRPDNPLLLRSNAPILRLQIDALESETLPKPDISAHFLLTHKDPVGTGEKGCQILCRWLQVASSSWPIETLGSELMPCSCTIEPASHGLHAPLRALSYASESRGICRGAHCYNTATYVDEEEDLWTPWSFWSSCSRTCGGGIQSRRRKCISLSRGLMACPGAQEEGRECNKQRCKGFQPHLVAQQRQKPSSLERFGTSGKKHPQSPVNNGESQKPVHKEWSQWSECSTTCGQGTQMRQRSCIQSPFASCDSPQQQLRDCNNSDVCPVDGAWKEWSSWSLCSFTCGRGVRTRSRDCRGPHSGGLPCEGTGTQTKVCNIALCPVDGHWADWADWPPCSVSCGNGTQQRLRECVGPIYGGAECLGPWSERRTCFVRQCPVDGRWLLWGPWSSCPVSCGGGSLRRERTCQGPFHGGRPCGGAAFENKPCSEHTCPAPHELCHEESWGSKTWQETLFGNVAYSQCPVDATGSVSRKCQLSSEGVAEWEKPSFWKCISHDIYALKKMMKDMQIIRQVSAPSMSKVIQDLADTSRVQIVYSGDILACLEVLRNFTDTCRRFRYKPSEHDSQNYIQIASNLLSEDNKMKWDDITQINPAIMDLVPIIVDFIHILGSGVKFSHIAYIFKENLAIAMHKVTPTDANTEIAFPAKGQEGLPEWVSSSEDRVVISRDSLSSQGQPLVHMLGIVMYKSLDFFLAKPRNETIINSRIITVSIRPEPKIKHSLLEIDFAHTSNGTKSFCVAWDTMSRDSGLGNWSTHDCKKVLDDGSHSRCQFERLSSFALMAQQHQSFRLEQPRPPSVTLVIGCAISSLALLLLIFVYTFIWRSIKSDRSVILINFCLSIISSNILILFGQTQTQNKVRYDPFVKPLC